jgi:ABC-2 type transport system permease protein
MLAHQIRMNTRLFFQGSLLSYKALFRWLDPPTYIASKILMPLSQLLFFTFLGIYAEGRDNATFYIIGNAVQMAAVSGIYGVTMSVGGDRWEGTLPYLFGVPSNRLVIFLGRAFVHILDGMTSVWIGLLWGVLLFGLDLSNADPLALMLTILITTFSTAGLGLILGALSLMTVNVMFVNNTVYFMLLVFSGANVPIDVMPGWMQVISKILPLTRGIEAARKIVDGAGLSEISPLLAGEFLVGIVYILAGYGIFHWFEYRARNYGTLDTI